MSRHGDFQVEPLRDMVAVGAVEARRARLWVRSPEPGPWRVRCASEDGAPVEGLFRPPPGGAARDHTCTLVIPDDVDPLAALTPGQRHLFRIETATGHEIGAGSFVTAPAGLEDGPERFAIGVMSCNQPFRPDGRVHPAAVDMLTAAHEVLREHDARLVFTVGDQVYADYPPRLSLFDPEHFARVAPSGRRSLLDCTVEEVRRLYHERYRRFWALPGWQAIHAHFPCYPILDDHELVDNWGSCLEHRDAGWQRVGEGARLAYLDYQGSRISGHGPLPESFQYTVERPGLPVFVLDLRSERRAGDDGRLLGPGQLVALERFLARHEDEDLLLIVCSVPVVHLPHWAARLGSHLGKQGEDFSDRWSADTHLRDRDRFLALLHAHQRRAPAQRLVLVSGDIHVGCAHEIRWDGDPAFYQLVSSAITNRADLLVRTAARLSIGFTRRVRARDGTLVARMRLLPAARGRGNPYAGLNVGLIEVDRSGPAGRARLRFLLYGHRGPRPRCVYRSVWIEPEALAPPRVAQAATARESSLPSVR